MIRSGDNLIDGIAVNVIRKKVKRISLRVRRDGSVSLTVPLRSATLRDAEAFLRSKWEWLTRTREHFMSLPSPETRVITPLEIARLQTLVAELHALWAARLGQPGVAWKLRSMKSRWGVCNWVKRRITYSEMLAGKPHDFVEFIVVHEFTHFDVHGHGPRFKALMDARLPDWRSRKRLS